MLSASYNMPPLPFIPLEILPTGFIEKLTLSLCIFSKNKFFASTALWRGERKKILFPFLQSFRKLQTLFRKFSERVLADNSPFLREFRIQVWKFRIQLRSFISQLWSFRTQLWSAIVELLAAKVGLLAAKVQFREAKVENLIKGISKNSVCVIARAFRPKQSHSSKQIIEIASPQSGLAMTDSTVIRGSLRAFVSVRVV